MTLLSHLLQKTNPYNKWWIFFCHVIDLQEGSAVAPTDDPPLNLLSMISETNPCLGLTGLYVFLYIYTCRVYTTPWLIGILIPRITKTYIYIIYIYKRTTLECNQDLVFLIAGGFCQWSHGKSLLSRRLHKEIWPMVAKCCQYCDSAV